VDQVDFYLNVKINPVTVDEIPGVYAPLEPDAENTGKRLN
jgi:hypothetical protein